MAGPTHEGAVMKNPYEVLRARERRVDQLRRETVALRFLIGLLDREEEADTVPAKVPSRRPATYLQTNSGRLEVIVGETTRLRFAGGALRDLMKCVMGIRAQLP